MERLCDTCRWEEAEDHFACRECTKEVDHWEPKPKITEAEIIRRLEALEAKVAAEPNTGVEVRRYYGEWCVDCEYAALRCSEHRFCVYCRIAQPTKWEKKR